MERANFNLSELRSAIIMDAMESTNGLIYPHFMNCKYRDYTYRHIRQWMDEQEFSDDDVKFNIFFESLNTLCRLGMGKMDGQYFSIDLKYCAQLNIVAAIRLLSNRYKHSALSVDEIMFFLGIDASLYSEVEDYVHYPSTAPLCKLFYDRIKQRCYDSTQWGISILQYINNNPDKFTVNVDVVPGYLEGYDLLLEIRSKEPIGKKVSWAGVIWPLKHVANNISAKEWNVSVRQGGESPGILSTSLRISHMVNNHEQIETLVDVLSPFLKGVGCDLWDIIIKLYGKKIGERAESNIRNRWKK